MLASYNVGSQTIGALLAQCPSVLVKERPEFPFLSLSWGIKQHRIKLREREKIMEGLGERVGKEGVGEVDL